MAVEKLNHQTVSRRGILKVIGGGVIVAAAGAGGFLATRDPALARQPWHTAGKDESDPRRRALSYAILAPNPHNRQPWLVDLVGDDQIILYCDQDRHLPMTDPFDRQITIGLGAFIETLVIAASSDGFSTEVNSFPEGVPMPLLDQRPVAQIRLIKGGAKNTDPLFAQLLERRTNRGEFSKLILAADLPDRLQSAAKYGSKIYVTTEQAKVTSLREIAVEAMRIEYVTPRTLGESIDLMRFGKREIIANPDGISLGGAFFDTLALLGQLDPANMRDPTSFAWKSGLESTLAPLATGSAYGWLVSPDNSRDSQINAGRDYARFNLLTTELAVDIHPNSQALQEYEEMTELFNTIHRELGVASPQRLQMFVRMGYGEEQLPSPRWPLVSRIRRA